MSDESEESGIVLTPHIWCKSELNENKKLLSNITAHISLPVVKRLTGTLLCYSCIDSHYEARKDLPSDAYESLYCYDLKRALRFIGSESCFVLYEVLFHNYPLLKDRAMLRAVYTKINDIREYKLPGKAFTIGLLPLILSKDPFVQEFFRCAVLALEDLGGIYTVPMLEDWVLVYEIVTDELELIDGTLNLSAIARVVDLLYVYFVLKGPVIQNEAIILVDRCLDMLKNVQDRFLAFKLCHVFNQSNDTQEGFREVYEAVLRDDYSLFARHEKSPSKPASVVLYPALYIFIDGICQFISIGKEREYLRILGELRNPTVVADSIKAIADNIFRMSESISTMTSYPHTTELFNYLLQQPYKDSIFHRLISETLCLKMDEARDLDFAHVIDKWSRFFVSLRTTRSRNLSIECFSPLLELFIFNERTDAQKTGMLVLGLKQNFIRLCEYYNVSEFHSDRILSRIFFWGKTPPQGDIAKYIANKDKVNSRYLIHNPVPRSVLGKAYKFLKAYKKHIPYLYELLKVVGQSPYNKCYLDYLVLFYHENKQIELIRSCIIEITPKIDVIIEEVLYKAVCALFEKDPLLAPLKEALSKFADTGCEAESTGSDVKRTKLSVEEGDQVDLVQLEIVYCELCFDSHKKMVKSPNMHIFYLLSSFMVKNSRTTIAKNYSSADSVVHFCLEYSIVEEKERLARSLANMELPDWDCACKTYTGIWEIQLSGVFKEKVLYYIRDSMGEPAIAYCFESINGCSRFWATNSLSGTVTVIKELYVLERYLKDCKILDKKLVPHLFCRAAAPRLSLPVADKDLATFLECMGADPSQFSLLAGIHNGDLRAIFFWRFFDETATFKLIKQYSEEYPCAAQLTYGTNNEYISSGMEYIKHIDIDNTEEIVDVYFLEVSSLRTPLDIYRCFFIAARTLIFMGRWELQRSSNFLTYFREKCPEVYLSYVATRKKLAPVFKMLNSTKLVTLESHDCSYPLVAFLDRDGYTELMMSLPEHCLKSSCFLPVTSDHPGDGRGHDYVVIDIMLFRPSIRTICCYLLSCKKIVIFLHSNLNRHTSYFSKAFRAWLYAQADISDISSFREHICLTSKSS